MPGQIHLETDSSVKPVILPPGKVLIGLKSKLKIELQRLEKIGVIEKVTEPSEWVFSLVSEMKSKGKLRIFIDPKPFNKEL
ncbi:hypothetical protein HOLleu_37133 [Holothuria leucospilota]|uniref:Uncharacterized protein n=1 Tax=Holothuria leucospilota TaxID=206669 RepID=A0A9Q0YGE4_HOLLE|nr:hypothetical protein HOLleu_37133 [Holothuria leucospilota]